MDIGYLWDFDKSEKTKKEHNVRFFEIVAALEDTTGFDKPDPQDHPDRWIWIGQTYERRILIVVYSDLELPIIRIITAYEAEGSLLDAYQNRRV